MITPRSSTRYMSPPFSRAIPIGARSARTTSTVDGSERRRAASLIHGDASRRPRSRRLLQRIHEPIRHTADRSRAEGDHDVAGLCCANERRYELVEGRDDIDGTADRRANRRGQGADRDALNWLLAGTVDVGE